MNLYNIWVLLSEMSGKKNIDKYFHDIQILLDAPIYIYLFIFLSLQNNSSHSH